MKENGIAIKSSSNDIITLNNLKIRLFDLNTVDKIPACKQKSINVRYDQWLNEKHKIKNKLLDRLGKNRRVHGRSCTVERIEADKAYAFLDEYHLLGCTKAKFNYGIFKGDELLGVASFGKKCPIDRWDGKSMSSELIRLCFIPRTTVIGGFTKILWHHMNEEKLDDIMTYVDRNWSNGDVYRKIGFYEEENIKTHFYFDEEKQKVLLPSALDKEQSCKRIEGAGSYKMIFYNEED